jgi:hypothetical protein
VSKPSCARVLYKRPIPRPNLEIQDAMPHVVPGDVVRCENCGHFHVLEIAVSGACGVVIAGKGSQ